MERKRRQTGWSGRERRERRGRGGRKEEVGGDGGAGLRRDGRKGGLGVWKKSKAKPEEWGDRAREDQEKEKKGPGDGGGGMEAARGLPEEVVLVRGEKWRPKRRKEWEDAGGQIAQGVGDERKGVGVRGDAAKGRTGGMRVKGVEGRERKT